MNAVLGLDTPTVVVVVVVASHALNYGPLSASNGVYTLWGKGYRVFTIIWLFFHVQKCAILLEHLAFRPRQSIFLHITRSTIHHQAVMGHVLFFFHLKSWCPICLFVCFSLLRTSGQAWTRCANNDIAGIPWKVTVST